MSIETMKQALEALELVGMEGWVERRTDAIIALRQAIDQSEKQEPFNGRILQRLLQTAWKKVRQEYKDDPECCFALGFDAGIDAVAPRVEPAVSQSGGGFESLPASPQAEKESTLQEISDIGQEAHTDHPMRHWDRTCPACVAETEPQRPVKSYTGGEPQYATYDMYTKRENAYTSAERVHEIDKSIHEPVPTWYSLSPHGDGYAIYRGRDLFHHGYNIGHLTEVTPDTVKMLESALNAAPPKTQNELDAIERAYFAGKQAGIAECEAVKREWVSLSDDEVEKLTEGVLKYKEFAIIIEAKLRERNT